MALTARRSAKISPPKHLQTEQHRLERVCIISESKNVVSQIWIFKFGPMSSWEGGRDGLFGKKKLLEDFILPARLPATYNIHSKVLSMLSMEYSG